MKHLPNAVANEEGSVLLLTLALLILLTIAGLGLLSTTDTDLQITQNDRCFKQNLTRAEWAVMEAARIMAYYESEKSKLKPTETGALTWIQASGFDPFGAGEWVSDSTDPAAQTAQTTEFPEQFKDSLPTYLATYEGIAPGASLDLASSTTMRQYEVIGRSEKCNGQLDVIAGYRTRF